MRHYSKSSVLWLVLATWFMLVITPIKATVLTVPEVIQEQTQWCWSATSQAVFAYYGTNLTQCQIANWTRQQAGWGNDDCCTNPGGAICNQPNWMYGASGSIEDILSNWGISCQTYSRALTQAEVETEIAHCRPFYIRWGWSTGGLSLIHI